MFDNLPPEALFSYMKTYIIMAIIVSYIYLSLTLMITARKLGVSNYYLAWIPVANLVLMSRMAKKHWWPTIFFVVAMLIMLTGFLTEVEGMTFFFFILPIMFLFLIPFLVFYYIWWWRITELLGREGWLVLFSFAPYLGSLWFFILWGMLAWGKSEKALVDNNNTS